MKLETLYKRAKTGKIVSYDISIEPSDDRAFILKNTGQLDGKKTLHKEEITEGKQKRSFLEQAEAQAESDWKRKRDEGYKSLKDLGITQHKDYVSKDGQDLSLQEMLDIQLPQFNTDASGNVKPMLAKEVNWSKVTYPCLVQPKLDGVRCLMIVKPNPQGNDSVVTFLSRSGKEYVTLEHIAETIIQFIVDKDYDKPFILDGEIYADDLTFQGISAAVKKEREDTLKLRFRAYDIVNDKVQENRISDMQILVMSMNSSHVEYVQTMSCNSQKEVKGLHDSYVMHQGFEGAMVRLRGGKYGQGQRSSDLLKVKEFMEEEFAFKNFEFGQRGVEDLIAVLWDGTGTKEFRAKMAGTKAHKEALYEEYKNGEGEGKSMTIKYFELTSDGVPRFPIGKGFRNYE